MSLSFTLACLWVVAACVAGLLPSKRSHWPAAYALMAAGVPVLGFVAYQHGLWGVAVCLIAGASILRWPVIYLVRWARARIG